LFQAEIYATLACAHEVQSQNRTERYVSICSHSLAALKALKAVKTSPLVYQCQRALNDSSIRQVVGLFWVPGHAGTLGNEIADDLAMVASALRIHAPKPALGFHGPEPVLGASRCDLQRTLRHWMTKQHGAQWRGLGDTQRKPRGLISGPSLGTRAKFMTFNKIQSRAFIGLLTGHNTLRRHLYLLVMHDSTLCRKCEVGEETSTHIQCECESLASFRNACLDSIFLEPENIEILGLGAIWNYCRDVGLP